MSANQEPNGAGSGTTTAEQPKKEPPPERESVTEGSVTVGGVPIPYRAVAATVTLRDGEAKPKASLFHVAYTRTDVTDPGRRPVTFAFNGGPGSSSAWLHMGLFGPRRVPLGDATTPPPPPYRAIENEFSILDVSDLVMIDPISTGWSRAADGEEANQFHGLREDTEWVAEFIRLWTARSGRWESPKFLMGESYGTTRAASLARHLQERHNMYLNGVVLVSSVLLFSTLRPDAGNDLPFIFYLPTYAATAWYHGLVRHDSLRGLTDAAEEFALGDYASVLLRGGRAPQATRDAAAERLAALTGLSRDFVERCDLRVSPQRFFKELLRDRRRTVGRLDSRYTGIDRDAAGEQAEYDAAMAMIAGPYAAAVNHYLRHELRFDSDLPYELLNGQAVQPWKWVEPGEARYPEVGSALRWAMNYNRNLKVLLASGYYDLATCFLAAEWTFDHLRLDPELRANLTTRRYEAGHMMYVHEPSLAALRTDLGAFVASAVPGD
jgi:carboxypeptidase C (cathepsin A)